MAFKFRLEPLLRYREELERREALLVAQAVNQLRAQQKGLDSLNREKGNLLSRWSSVYGGKTQAYELQLLVARRDQINAAISEQMHHLEDAKRRLQDARQRWVQAKKDRRILEIIKEKALRDFLADQRRMETKLLDEVSIRPYIHHRSKTVREE